MTEPVALSFAAFDAEALAAADGRIALLVEAEGRLGPEARKIDALTRKAVSRLLVSPDWEKAKAGEASLLTFPAGLTADGLVVVKVPRKPTEAEARAAGSAIAKVRGKGPLTVVTGSFMRVEDLALALGLRSYDFVAHKTAPREEGGPITLMVADPEAARSRAAPWNAVASGVFLTRDLVSEPANVLTTTEFARRLEALREVGVEVEVLEEEELERQGMRLLLAVGQGSESPSKVVVMRWNGGGEEPPFALVGKGVVFDTGGISMKPAGGMEDMTMDMGGAAVVAGVMRTLALRRARANVVGLVGLVENMPSGNATRPGDVVRSLKGDTVEIINTDAEGRLVLADVLWYAQERFQPTGIVDLATLTGAIIVALGHENAGVFSNDDALADALLAAARAEGEGAWRMPMGEAFDRKLKSRIADMMNVGGRDGGSITAAQFIRRFVKDETPWCHIDIAGVASTKSETALAPKGATGWGVMTLNRLIAERYEAKE
jgi:leucyl aminopeptidase